MTSSFIKILKTPEMLHLCKSEGCPYNSLSGRVVTMDGKWMDGQTDSNVLVKLGQLNVKCNDATFPSPSMDECSVLRKNRANSQGLTRKSCLITGRNLV